MANNTYADQFNEYFVDEEEKLAFLETKPVHGYWANYWNHLTKNLFKYQGVESRSDFWRFFLIYILVYLLLILVLGVFTTRNSFYFVQSNHEMGFAYITPSPFDIFYTFIMAIYYIWGTLAFLSCTCRRLHDVNYSGWLQLIQFIPLIGTLILILFFLIREPNYNCNRYLYDEAVATGFIRKYRNTKE